MTKYGYFVILAYASPILAGFFLWHYYGLKVRHIIEKSGLDKENTFLSTGGRRRILIYTLEPDALVVRIMTNVLMPKLSIYKKQYSVPYDQIDRVEIGQGNTTIKLKKIISEETAVFGYMAGSIARPSENWKQVIFTSASTRKAFKEKLEAHGVQVKDVSTSRGRALKIALITAFIVSMWGILLWMYSLGWLS